VPCLKPTTQSYAPRPQAILYRANRIYGVNRAAIQAIVEAINNQQQKEKE
jgi:hypothetical protein